MKKFLFKENIKLFIASHLIFSLFLILFFIKTFNTFKDFEPRFDQIRHIAWIIELHNADHLINLNKIFNLEKDHNGFLFQLFRMSAEPGGYHAYYFQMFSVLVNYIAYLFYNGDVISLYNFTSVFFSTLSILISYLIGIYLLKIQSIKYSKLLFQIVFILISFSYYKFYFSPLGHHNISIFFYLLIIYLIFLIIDADIKYKYFYIGLCFSFGIFFHLVLTLFLLPAIFVYILIENKKSNLKNLLQFLITILPFFLPLIFLLYFNLNYSSGYDFDLMLGEKTTNFNLLYNRIKNWLNYTIYLNFLLLLFFLYGFFYYIIKRENLKNNKKILFFYIIVLVSFLLNTFTNIIQVSYLRNSIYLHHVFIIITIFFFFKKYNSIKSLYKLIIFLILLANASFNLVIIQNPLILKKIDNFFFDYYFKDQGVIKNSLNEIQNIINKEEKLKIVFYNQLSSDYFQVYLNDIYNKHYHGSRHILDLSFIVKNLNTLNKSKIDNYTVIKGKIFFVGIVDDPKIFQEDFDVLKNNKYYKFNCLLNKYIIYENRFLPNNLQNIVLPNNLKIYLMKADC